ncbi:hypothetical protein DFQ26_008073 [Actinomortierella ambigua]|nr:hypothetical protein DFQ26_008073 [Actinomortierella ambigua]
MAVGSTPESFQDVLGNNTAVNNPLAEVGAMQEPRVNDHDPYSALSHLFQVAVKDPDAVMLCGMIDMPMTPPVDQGVITYLLRLEAIGRLSEWPRLFGQGNAFVLHLLDKLTNNRFLASELGLYEDRRRETMIWRANKI